MNTNIKLKILYDMKKQTEDSLDYLEIVLTKKREISEEIYKIEETQSLNDFDNNTCEKIVSIFNSYETTYKEYYLKEEISNLNDFLDKLKSIIRDLCNHNFVNEYKDVMDLSKGTIKYCTHCKTIE